jgi:hypothetical protein
MKPSVVRKAHRIAKYRAPKPRMHFLWCEQDEPRDAVRARIRAMIASGEASPNDRLLTFTGRGRRGRGLATDAGWHANWDSQPAPTSAEAFAGADVWALPRPSRLTSRAPRGG